MITVLITIILSILSAIVIFASYPIYELVSKPIYLYPMLIAILISGSLLFAGWARKKYYGIRILPSLVTVSIFLITPAIGYFGYRVFVKMYGSYFGTTNLNFTLPLYIWFLGATFFFFGVITAHILTPRNMGTMHHAWNVTSLKMFMILFGIAALSFTAIAISLIGYIPILKGNIGFERFTYEGRTIIKFSRLWMIVAFLAAHLYFLDIKKKRYLLVIVISSFFLVMYGQRAYLFIPLAYLFLLYFKYERKTNFRLLIIALVASILLFSYVAKVRGSWTHRLQKATPIESIAFNTFGEWREFSYVINNFKPQNLFLREKIFWGVFAALLPKEIWHIFGIDKDQLLAYNASEYFGRYFGHYAGIRIGLVGECYAGYGIGGIIVIMPILGLIFGFIENKYLAFKASDPRLSFIIFALSVLIFLPLLTFINITTIGIFFGFFILLYTWFCRRRV